MTFLQRKSSGRWLNAPLGQSASWHERFSQSQSIFGNFPKISASEAVLAFAAWLTCRENSVTLGAHHHAGCAVDLVKEWLDANRLPDPRQIFPRNIRHPGR
jgi:hypothetical protein